MRDLSENGLRSETSTVFETEANLANKLAASIYLAETGVTGSLEDICYYLTVELAATRQANKDMYEMMSNEVERYRHRWTFERNLATDCLDDIVDLEAQVEALTLEAESYAESFETAQERLENALSTVDAITPMIDWNGLLND